MRLTRPYDKWKCFLHGFPLIRVHNRRKMEINEKLHRYVDFRPIPSDVGNLVSDLGNAGSMSAIWIICKIQITLILVFNSAVTTLWSKGLM